MSEVNNNNPVDPTGGGELSASLKFAMEMIERTKAEGLALQVQSRIGTAISRVTSFGRRHLEQYAQSYYRTIASNTAKRNNPTPTRPNPTYISQRELDQLEAEAPNDDNVIFDESII